MTAEVVCGAVKALDRTENAKVKNKKFTFTDGFQMFKEYREEREWTDAEKQ